MLRAALIGFGSSGKSTLFQLMTSAHEHRPGGSWQGRNRGRHLESAGRAARRLTAMYNPKKRVPATVEFTDLAVTGAAGGAKALVDVVAYKNADALVHVLRAFRRPVGPLPSGSVESRARRPGDGRRAHPRRPRRRRAPPRTARQGPEEGAFRRARTRARGRPDAARHALERRPAAARARPQRRGSQATARLSVPLGQAAAHRHQPRRIADERRGRLATSTRPPRRRA